MYIEHNALQRHLWHPSSATCCKMRGWVLAEKTINHSVERFTVLCLSSAFNLIRRERCSASIPEAVAVSLSLSMTCLADRHRGSKEKPLDACPNRTQTPGFVHHWATCALGTCATTTMQKRCVSVLRPQCTRLEQRTEVSERGPVKLSCLHPSRWCEYRRRVFGSHCDDQCACQ